MERRSSPRARCRIPCEISQRRKRGSGVVMDVSEGGLSVHTEMLVEHGDTLHLRFRLPGGGPVELEAMVWHLRRARRKQGGQSVSLLGLMLAKAPDAYLDFVPHPRLEQAPPASAEEDPALVTPDAAAPLRDFRVRVKARSGPRSRVLCLAAASSEDAHALAGTELGEEWEILEVTGG